MSTEVDCASNSITYVKSSLLYSWFTIVVILNCIISWTNLLLGITSSHPSTSQDGQKPILVAAARGNREVVEVLLPLTSKIESVHNWTVDGIIEYMQSESSKEQVIIMFCFQ